MASSSKRFGSFDGLVFVDKKKKKDKGEEYLELLAC